MNFLLSIVKLFCHVQQRRLAIIGLCLVFIGLGGFSPTGSAGTATTDLVIAVQPILDADGTRKSYGPLCHYLARATGKTCHIYTSPNFLSYWQTMRASNAYNLVLDAAHFTDYRITKLGYVVLVKIPDTVSYSLVVLSKNLILDPTELVGRHVATLGIPSMGAARLNQMFPNPSRQPITVEVADAERGVDLLVQGKVLAAILPTPIISQYMQRGSPLSVVLTTDPIPHVALSAAPSMDVATREIIRKALLDVSKTEGGKQMLKQIGLEQFDPATAAAYAGQSRVLMEYS